MEICFNSCDLATPGSPYLLFVNTIKAMFMSPRIFIPSCISITDPPTILNIIYIIVLLFVLYKYPLVKVKLFLHPTIRKFLVQ